MRKDESDLFQRDPFYFALNLNYGINYTFFLVSNTLSDRILAEVIDSDRKGGIMKLFESECIELKAVYIYGFRASSWRIVRKDESDLF